MKIRITAFIPAIIWFIGVTVLLVLPGPDIPHTNFMDEIYFDKWVHIGLFGGLTFLAAFPYVKANLLNKKLLIKICIIVLTYGVLMEFVQKYIAFERSFDYFDMIADSVGCLFGSVAATIYLKRRLRIKNKPL